MIAFRFGLAFALLSCLRADAVEAPKIVDGNLLISRTYQVPPTFLHSGGGGVGEAPSPRTILERAGVEFGRGTLAQFFPKYSMLVVRNTRDQHELLEAYIGGCGLSFSTSTQITVILERIAVERDVLSKWLRENRIVSDGTPLRRLLQKHVGTGSAIIIETVVLRANSGQRMKSESVAEYLHPTDWEIELPPEIESLPSSRINDSVALPEFPVAFETRHIGTTFEADVWTSADDTMIDVNLYFKNYALEGRETWPNEDLETTFQTQRPTISAQRKFTQVTVTDGHYVVVDTVSAMDMELADGKFKDPVVIIFVRADVAKQSLNAGGQAQ